MQDPTPYKVSSLEPHLPALLHKLMRPPICKAPFLCSLVRISETEMACITTLKHLEGRVQAAKGHTVTTMFRLVPTDSLLSVSHIELHFVVSVTC